MLRGMLENVYVKIQEEVNENYSRVVPTSAVEPSSSSTRDLQYDCDFNIPGPTSVETQQAPIRPVECSTVARSFQPQVSKCAVASLQRL
jgi:hypothetical protein